MSTGTNGIIVSDTSPITNLAAINQLDLLRQIYGRIVIPKAVYDEMASVGKVVPGTVEVKTLDWIETRAVTDNNRVINLRNNQDEIDLGEAEAIVLAQELNAELLLMDERRGRSVAIARNLKVVGLLGVLLQAKQKGLILALKPMMNQLIDEADFRVSPQLYTTVLQAAHE